MGGARYPTEVLKCVRQEQFGVRNRTGTLPVLVL